MSGATSDVVNVNVLATGHHRDTVISGGNNGMLNLDFLGNSDVDSVSVGAVCGCYQFDAGKVHIFAREYVDVGVFAVD